MSSRIIETFEMAFKWRHLTRRKRRKLLQHILYPERNLCGIKRGTWKGKQMTRVEQMTQKGEANATKLRMANIIFFDQRFLDKRCYCCSKDSHCVVRVSSKEDFYITKQNHDHCFRILTLLPSMNSRRFPLVSSKRGKESKPFTKSTFGLHPTNSLVQ